MLVKQLSKCFDENVTGTTGEVLCCMDPLKFHVTLLNTGASYISVPSCLRSLRHFMILYRLVLFLG